jgi:hypothetical protein
MRDHVHLICSRTNKDGQQDQHRLVVRARYLDREVEVSRGMGYTLTRLSCQDPTCLGPEPVSRGTL